MNAAELPPRPPLDVEVATLDKDPDVTIAELLEPRDKLLKEQAGGDYAVYEALLLDDKIASCYQQRRLAVLALDWVVVEPGDEENPATPQELEAAAWVRAECDRINLDELTDKLLFATHYGFAVAEAVYFQGEDGLIHVTPKVRKQKRFGFGPALELKLKTTDNPEGEVVPPEKFVVVRSGGDSDDDPYGLGLAAQLYWPAIIKKQDAKFWMNFLESFATPAAKGTYPANATDDEKAMLLEAIAALRGNAGITVPEGTMVELLEASRNGSADYTALYDRLNDAIAQVILGQTMTSADGSSRSQAQVHLDVRDELIKADADLVCNALSHQLFARLVWWNFGPDVRPPLLWRRSEEETDLDLQSQIDERLYGMGWQRTPESVADMYGEGFVPKEGGNMPIGEQQPLDGAGAPMDEPGAESPAQFAERPTAAAKRAGDTADAIAGRLSEFAEPMVTGWVDQVRGRLMAADSLPQFAESLYTMFPDMPSEQLVELMGQAFHAARLAGFDDAANDTEE